ncbi:hypothetical protein ABT352_32820 [Streptosporangium sp. NPDC000563]|uniref:hypothetical protein n=1 Tax=Streptosporangium sp. NPDC000563 TaxID=3154366 RepID=UPI0033298841
MPELKQRAGDQPLPTVNDYPDIQSLVIQDISDRREVGIGRYGTALQPWNGRDELLDAYEEAMDLTCYLRQAMAERDSAPRDTAPCDWCGEASASDAVTMTYSAGNQTHFLLCPPCTNQATTQGAAYAAVRRLPLAAATTATTAPAAIPFDPPTPGGHHGELTQPDELHAAAERMRAVARAAREEMRRDPQWHHTYGQEISASLGGPCGDLAELWDPDQTEDVADLLDELADDIIVQAPAWENDPKVRVPVAVLVEQRYARPLAIARRINVRGDARRAV